MSEPDSLIAAEACFRVCDGCGQRFPKYRKRRYCNDECWKNCYKRPPRRKTYIPVTIDRRVKPKTQLCRWCGSVYARIGRSRAQLCSRECSTASKASKASKRNLKVRHVYKCQFCEVLYQAKTADRSTFCSRGCAFASKKAKARRLRPQADKPMRKCVVCCCLFNDRRSQYCSAGCRDNANLGWYRKNRICIVCGKMLVAGTRLTGYTGKVCSEECRIEIRKSVNRGKHKTRRERIRTTRVPYIRLHVFKRDGWRCQLCGGLVDQTQGKTHRLAPSVDHIVPLARGGADRIDNVQCAHLCCNIAKGDAIDGETVSQCYERRRDASIAIMERIDNKLLC